jgi:hypothetical protein
MPEKTCFRVPFRRKYELTKLALRATGFLIRHIEECDACQAIEVDDDIESLDDPRLLLCPDGTTLNVIRREKQGRRERFASI